MAEQTSKWTLETAIDAVRRVGGKVNMGSKTVSCPKAGIKTMGVVSYLVRYQGFSETAN
jgi:hypothetical protein